MAMICPSCGGELVELDRSGVRIDACRSCRGVWLDRGELERVVEHERRRIVREAVCRDDNGHAAGLLDRLGVGEPQRQPVRVAVALVAARRGRPGGLGLAAQLVRDDADERRGGREDAGAGAVDAESMEPARRGRHRASRRARIRALHPPRCG